MPVKWTAKDLWSHAAWGNRPLQLGFFDPPDGQSG